MIDLWASLKVVWRYLSIVLFFSPGYDEIINCSLCYFIYIFGIGKIFFKLFSKDKFFFDEKYSTIGIIVKYCCNLKKLYILISFKI